MRSRKTCEIMFLRSTSKQSRFFLWMMCACPPTELLLYGGASKRKYSLMHQLCIMAAFRSNCEYLTNSYAGNSVRRDRRWPIILQTLLSTLWHLTCIGYLMIRELAYSWLEELKPVEVYVRHGCIYGLKPYMPPCRAYCLSWTRILCLRSVKFELFVGWRTLMAQQHHSSQHKVCMYYHASKSGPFAVFWIKYRLQLFLKYTVFFRNW